MEWGTILELVGWGFFAGILGGILGVGGGVVFVVVLPPVLLAVGVNQADLVPYTVANSLFSTIFTTLSANLRLYLDRQIFWRQVLLVSTAGIISSLALLRFFVNTRYYSQRVFDWVFLGVLFIMLLRLIIKNIRSFGDAPDEIKSRMHAGSLTLLGMVAGAVSPLTGMGGGIVLVPGLHSVLNYPIKQANAISLGFIGITALGSTWFNMLETPPVFLPLAHAGYIIFPVALALSSGGIAGALIGLSIGKKIKPDWLSFLFAGFMVIILFKKLSQML